MDHLSDQGLYGKGFCRQRSCAVYRLSAESLPLYSAGIYHRHSLRSERVFGSRPSWYCGCDCRSGFAGWPANIAGGILLLTFKPFQVGDYIIIAQQNGCEGTVYKIEICYTTLISIDNKHIVIPNGTLSSSIITNVTARDLRKLEIKVGISYDADIHKAKELLEDILHNDEDTKDDKGMVVFVDELGESAVIMGLRVWVATDKYWPAKWRLNELIKESFDANGIEIPYNQLQIHVKKQKTEA